MSQFDNMYLDLCDRILSQGVKTQARNGITYRIPGNVWDFDLSKEFPILTTKSVAFKSAILEILWFYQAQSNRVQWLRDRGVHIWDKWEVSEDGIYRNPDTGSEKFFGKEWAGTIGSAYGYIVKKYNLMNECIRKIKEEPENRRNIISLWQDCEIPTAVLPSCVWNSTWMVLDGKLYSFVEQRSCDTAVGVPFNIVQYAALTCMLAHVTGLKPGVMHYEMVDVHIYEKHIDGIKEQLSRRNDALPAPKLWLNPEVKDFYEFDNSKELKDIKLIDYQHLDRIKFDVIA